MELSSLCETESRFCITKTRIFKYIVNFTTKNWKFSEKKSDVFHISAQNIDCGYSLEPPLRGGSNEYSQSMFLSRNKKNNAYPCKPQFYYIKVGFKGGSKLYRYVFVMVLFCLFENKPYRVEEGLAVTANKKDPAMPVLPCIEIKTFLSIYRF